MFILDSLSLTGATTAAIQQQTILEPAKAKSSVLKSSENVDQNLKPLKVTPFTFTNDSCEMTTNKCKLQQQQQQQRQQQHPEPQQQYKAVEKCMIQKTPSPSPHKTKEIIKNNNENLTDELAAMASIENNMTIADNSKPQEEKQNNDNVNKNGNENSSAVDWGNVPATYECYHSYNDIDIDTTTDHQTSSINALTTTAANTSTTTTTNTFKAFNVDNVDENNVQEKEILLTNNIQSNVDLNTFVLPPEATAATATPITTLKNCNSSACSSGYCFPFGVCIRDSDTRGMFVPQKKSNHSCNINNDTNCISATSYDNDDGGSFCHNSNNYNNNNIGSSNNNNNNNVILNTNSFVTVECTSFTCESEREQETQNGCNNSGNVSAAAAATETSTTIIANKNSTGNNEIMAEFSTVVGEHKYCSTFSHSCERIEDPIGNNSSPFTSPVDSVLENFEKFLNAVKFENQNLNQTVAECCDLIDLSVEPNGSIKQPEENILHGECNKLKHIETNLKTLLNNNSETINSVENHTEQSETDAKMYERQSNFENLLYCDLNETLEEQNLLESKEISKLTTAELKPNETVVEKAKVEKTFIKGNKIERIGDREHNDKFYSNILMLDEVNEMIAKTPVTCTNVYTINNNDVNFINNSKEQHEACAVEQQKDSCQNSNICYNRTVTATATETVTVTPTTEIKVPLENILRNKICSSSSSIENSSPLIQNKIVKNHNQNQSANIKKIRSAVNGADISISCCSTNTQTQLQSDFAEYKNNCHHLQLKQQQERVRDQFTSAYTLRDFAKCLKPSADEDIIYTLNFTQNENENKKEKWQNFNFNLNSNKNFPSNENETSEIKSIESFSEKTEDINSNFNENNLYNKICDTEKVLEADSGWNLNLSHQIKNSNEIELKSELISKGSLTNPEIKKLKDTQFWEIENLSTPINQTALNAQKSNGRDNKEGNKLTEFNDRINSSENCQISENFNNELKFNCNEKIYTRETNSQPLLYLTFVWPAKNEGQVVTTRRQGNGNQGVNETETVAAAEKEYRFKKNYNTNSDDKYKYSCEFAQRVLQKTYGTCNRNHVEGSQKGQQLNTVESEKLEKHKPKKETFNNNDGDLFASSLLIDKQTGEHKTHCLHYTNTRQSEEELIIKNEKYFERILGKPQKNPSVLKKENELENVKNNKIEENLHNNIKSVKEIDKKLEKSKESEQNCKENIIDENCVSQSEKLKSGQNEFKSENTTEIKSLVIDIKPNNPHLNKTESVCNQDNGENILNLNERLKRLNETKQNINNNQLLLLATYNTPTIKYQQHHHHHNHHHHNNPLIEKEQEDQLNLEEFEASQRLKRLLQQQQQFRIRYDTIPTTTTTAQLDNYKQTKTIVATTTTTATNTKESLKTEIARHSKDDLLIPNNPLQGVVNTIATKANKLQVDCEITLERSSLIRANEYPPRIIEINKNLKEQTEYSDSNKEQVDLKKGKKAKAKAIDEKEIAIKILNNKEYEGNVNENKRNSPRAYVSKKIVRLSQPKPKPQQRQTQQQTQLYSKSLPEIDLTDKHQEQEKQQQQQQTPQNTVIDKLSNLRFPFENIDNKTEISKTKSSTTSKLCNLNLQHIVKTKQLVQQQQEEQNVKEIPIKSCTPSPPPTPPFLEPQINEYRSAFVPTKPEIYKYIKPLTATKGNLITNTTTIPLIPATVTLSEFDTQRFSDFLYLNHLANSLNNNNNNNNNSHYNNNYQIAHVLPTQQQQQELQQVQQYQPYPLHTTNLVQPIQLPYCYDELLLNETQQEPLNAATATFPTRKSPNITTDISVDNGDIQIEDDLISISSNNSSPCDCINCQQQQTEQEIDRKRDRDRLFSIDTKNVIHNDTKAITFQQQQQQLLQETSIKMREVNGQLRGLLKKPNRPPPTRKNRVVFDETRNEFFEADYIILIREDCAYDEEDEEPCTCGEHELVRLCCEEGCQCNYTTASAATDDNRTPQSPKYAPPIEFVDEAALSPPDGYKDNGLKNTLGGALSGHIFGAQHLQQLQVIQRLQQQRAAMLAARNNSQIPHPPPPATANPSSATTVNQQSSTATSTCPSSSPLNSTTSATAATVATTVVSNNNMNQTAAIQQHSPDDDTQGVCTECAECAECAAKQLQQDTECNSPQCQEDLTAQLGVPAVALLPIHTSSPERRMTQKEIIAGEERPRYVLQAQYKSSPDKNRRDSSKNRNKFITVQKTNNQRYVVETITMTTTTVSERRIVREATEDLAANATSFPAITATSSATSSAALPATTALTAGGVNDLLPPALPAKPGAAPINNDLCDAEKPPPIPPKESSPTTHISGILKGGKLWKQDSISQHSDDQNNTTSEDEAGSSSNGTIKRSVRFVTEEISNDEVDGQMSNVDEDNQINELIPIKKHSTLFKNALRPNSAVQQLFPSTVSHQTLTSEALRAFDESKRAGCLVSTLPGSAGDSDTLRRSMERNILRRSLIKKKAVKSDISLEERIKQLTCGIDEENDELAQENGDDDNSKLEDNNELSHRDSPAGEENPQKFNVNGNNSDKSFSPNSSVSSSSSGSSAYKKITEIFNREKKNHEKIMEMEENPIVIIPQECRCPAAPDLGMGVQVPVVHTQIHRTPPRQTEPKRQFLSTLAPLTACVAGNKDDLSSYYTLAAAHHNQAAQNAHAAEYNLAAIIAGEQNTTGLLQSSGDEVRKVAPDVIAGTPGQEQQDELVAFAQQEANRTDKIKKRYSNEQTNTKETNKEINSDDDEGNDYGFNKRPSVRGIKPKFSSTNEILQQMQDQLSQQMPTVVHSQPLPQPMKSYTLPKQSSASAMTKQLSQQQPSPQNVPHPAVATSQQQLPQQQQMCNTVGPPTAMQIPANTAIAQQQTEQRTWSFYSETGGAGEQQRVPVESNAAAMQQTYYQTLPAGAMFRHTMIHQHQQHGPDEAMLYAQNCQAVATTIEPQPHYGHYARSPTRRPESPPPLRNYHQTMVLIPYNAETYSQFAATNMDPKVAHLQRQNILEYQQVGEMTQVTQQTIRVPIGYALPGMQLHVVAGRGHAAQYATAAAAQTHHHQHQRIMTQRYQFAQEASMAGFSERGVPEGAAAVSHTDCASSGMVSPTSGQQIAMQQQQQQQLQQGNQLGQQQQQVNCQQQQQAQPQTQNSMHSAAQGSVYYAMNV